MARDGTRFRDLHLAAVGLMTALYPLPPDWDLPDRFEDG